MHRRLFSAAKHGKVEEVKKIVGKNPNLDVNSRNEEEAGYTALHFACEQGHDAIVSILLAQPGIDVNQRSNNGSTPFFVACWNGKTSCARLLLLDSRVKNLGERTKNGSTSLRCAVRDGHVEIIQWWIVSGREMDLGELGVEGTDAVGRRTGGQSRWEREGLKWRRSTLDTLLGKFAENPEDTRRAVRAELGWYDETATRLFARVVFVSARFFRMACQLPLELQMVLCYRVVGSARETIHGKDSEVAFRELAKRI